VDKVREVASVRSKRTRHPPPGNPGRQEIPPPPGAPFLQGLLEPGKMPAAASGGVVQKGIQER